MYHYDAILFDFDGTLAELVLDFDLMKTKIAALGECFLPYRPVPDGMAALEWVDHLAGLVRVEAGRDAALEFHCRCRLAITAMEMDAAREGRLFPFTRPLLETLDEAGVASAVITRNITPAVRTVFPDIDTHVRVVLAREDVQDVKPHPGHLLAALERLGVAPGRALMVGDHPLDVEAGRRAGTATVAVASGNAAVHELEAAGPNAVLADASLLPEYIGLI